MVGGVEGWVRDQSLKYVMELAQMAGAEAHRHGCCCVGLGLFWGGACLVIFAFVPYVSVMWAHHGCRSMGARAWLLEQVGRDSRACRGARRI